MEDDNIIAKLLQMWVYQREIPKNVRAQVYFAARRSIRIFYELHKSNYIQLLWWSAKLPITLLLEKIIIPKKKNIYGRKHLSIRFLKSLPIPHKSFLLPSIIPNILCYWKILTPLGPIQICDVRPVLHIIAGERIFWLAFQQRTNKNQVQQNKNMFQCKSSFCPTELKYHSHQIYHDMN